MGQRSRTETVASVLAALLGQRSWSQAALARHVGVGREALRKLLEELQSSGVPLESDRDHPHVYWSVPQTWYPGGVLFPQGEVPELLRQIRRLPRGKARDALLATIVAQLPGRAPPAADPVVSRPTTEPEEQWIPVVEDAATKRVAMQMRYLTASRVDVSDRHVSVQLLEVGPPARFIATCHRNGDLRRFRVDGIVRARLDPQEPFRAASPEAVAAFRAASVDGYRGAGASVALSFFVRKPESSWVANNLLEGMRAESLHDGIRVSAHTSALEQIARFVVGLGGAARPEHPSLAEAVKALARGALDGAQTDVATTGSASTDASPATRV